MSLPDLALQIVYGRLAWALVAAAVLLALLPKMVNKTLRMLSVDGVPAESPAPGRRAQALVVAGLVLLMALPGAASPAYWLILVFQYPSGLLLGLSMVSLAARWRARPVRYTMAPALALALVTAGLVLYLDAFGVLALGLYYVGFGAAGAPLLACAAAVGCALAIVRGRATGAAAALLAAVLLFSLLRLPTGNLWDALLDPLLWAWALGSAVAAAFGMAGARKGVPRAEPAGLDPALDPALDPELVPAHASGIEQQL